MKNKENEKKMNENFFFRDMSTKINYRFSSGYTVNGKKEVKIIDEDQPLSNHQAFNVITYLIDIYKPNSKLKDFKEQMSDMAMVKRTDYGEIVLFDHTFFEKIYTYTDYLDEMTGNTLASAFYGMILLGEVKKILEYPIFVSIIQSYDQDDNLVEILDSFKIKHDNAHMRIPYMNSKVNKTSLVSYCSVNLETDVVSIKMAIDGEVGHYDFLKEVEFLPPHLFYSS